MPGRQTAWLSCRKEWASGLPWRSSGLPIWEVCKQMLAMEGPATYSVFVTDRHFWISLVRVKDSHSLCLGPQPPAADWCGCLMSLGWRTSQLAPQGAILETLVQSRGAGQSRDQEGPSWGPSLARRQVWGNSSPRPMPNPPGLPILSFSSKELGAPVWHTSHPLPLGQACISDSPHFSGRSLQR